MNPALRESVPVSGVERVVRAGAQQIEDKPLVLLQANCRSILNKTLEFWNLVDTYNPDVIIGTGSWLREEINNAEVFRDDYSTFRRDRCTRGGGVFICVKNYIDCRELWADQDFEMIAIEVKGRDPKFTWEIQVSTEPQTMTCELWKCWQTELVTQEILQSVASLGGT